MATVIDWGAELDTEPEASPQTDWGAELDAELGQRPEPQQPAPAQPPFDPEGSGYDYESARRAGLSPDETGHWQSRDPKTGLLLKGRKHKTWDLLEQGEQQAGYKISKGADGRYYSQPKQPAPVVPQPEQPEPKEYEFEGTVYQFPQYRSHESIQRFFDKMTADRRTLTPEEAGGRSLHVDSEKHAEKRRLTQLSEQGIAEIAEFLSGKDAEGKPVVVKPEDITRRGMMEVIDARKKKAAEWAKEPNVNPVWLREFNEDTAALDRELDRSWSSEKMWAEKVLERAKQVFEDEAITLPDGSTAKPTKAARMETAMALVQLPEMAADDPRFTAAGAGPAVIRSNVVTRKFWMMTLGTMAIRAANRIKAGDESLENYVKVAAFLEEDRKIAEEYERTSGTRKTIDALANTLGFVGAMVAGAPAQSLVEKAITKGVAKGARGLARKTAAVMAGEITRQVASPGLQQMVAQQTIERMVPRGIEPTGELKPGDPFVTALAKSSASTLISQLTERSGQAMFKLPGMGRLKTMLAKVVGREPGTIRKAAAWNNIFAEWGEERLEDVAQGVFSGVTGDGFNFGPTADVLSGDPERRKRGLEAFKIEGVVIGMISGPGTAADIARRRARANQLKPLADKWRKGGSATEAMTGMPAVIKEPIPTEGVWAWAIQEENAEAVNELLTLDSPSREQWRKVGLRPAETSVRQQFVKDLRELKEIQDAERTPRQTEPTGEEEGAEGEAVGQVRVRDTEEGGEVEAEEGVTPPVAEGEVAPAPKAPVEQPEPAKPTPTPTPTPQVKPPQPPPKVGQYVQWTSQGVDQWKKPKRVAGVSEDGNFLFVEGATTGIPVAETTAVDKETQRDLELRTQSKQEVGDWKRRTKRAGGRVADATFGGLQKAVNDALKRLGLKKASDDMSPEGIKNAFRDAAMKAHPDRGGSPEAMAEVNAAYELLMGSPATLELAKRKWEREQQKLKPQPEPTAAEPEAAPAAPETPVEAPPGKPTQEPTRPVKPQPEVAQEPETALDEANTWISVSPAKYAKNSVAVQTKPIQGFKSRAARLAEALKGRFSHREGAYILSKAKAAKLQEMLDNGWDANSISKELTPPEGISDYSGLDAQQLSAIAKQRGLEGYQGKKKTDLVAMLEEDDRKKTAVPPTEAKREVDQANRNAEQQFYDTNLPTAKKQTIREDIAMSGARLGKNPEQVVADLVANGSLEEDAIGAVRYGFEVVTGAKPDIAPVSEAPAKPSAPKKKLGAKKPILTRTEVEKAQMLDRASAARREAAARQAKGELPKPAAPAAPEAPAETEGAKEATAARKPVAVKRDEIDLSGLSDQQLRHLGRQHKPRTYGDDLDLEKAIAAEIQSRGIKDYQEGPEEAKPLLDKYMTARNLREEKQRDVTTAHTRRNTIEENVIVNEAHTKRGVPLGGRGEYGLSAAKKWKKQIADAKEAAKSRQELLDATQKIKDAEAEVERAKQSEKEAERAWNQAAAEGMPNIPEGQVRYAIEGRSQVKVGKFDLERGQYQVDSHGMKSWVSPQPLLDNYVSKEERAELKKIEDEYRKARAEINSQQAQRAATERATTEKAQLKESRQKVRREAANIDYFRTLKERAKNLKTKKKQTLQVDDDKIERPYSEVEGETWGNWGVAKVRDAEGIPVKGEVDLIHLPTNKIAITLSNIPAAKQLAQMIDESGLDYEAARVKGDKQAQRNLEQVYRAWKDDTLSGITDADLAAKFVPDAVEAGITADIILDSYDLGKHGTTQGMTDRGIETVKQLVKEVPEFAYDPVFVVDNEGNLVFRDHYTFKFPPGLFNLHPSEVQPGQTVGINLPDLGLTREMSQAKVVAAVLKNEGYTAKSSGTSDRLTVRREGKVFSVFKDRGTEWRVQGPDPAMEKDLQRLVSRIRWDHHSMQEKIAVAREETQPVSKAAEEGGGTARMTRPAAAPTRQSRSVRAKVEGERVGIAAADIVKTVERLFGVAVRQGGFSQRAAGIYKWITKRGGKPSPEVVRTAEDHYANLAAVSHEVAHHVDEKTKAVKSAPKQVRDELKRLDYEPEKGRAFEGWAEFIRRYITEPPIDIAGRRIPNPGIDAPKTLAWFEDIFLPAHGEFARPIEEFRRYAQQFAQQSVFQRVGTLISDRKPQDLDFKTRWLKKSRRWFNRLKTSAVDKFHTLEWIQKESQRRGHEGIGIYDLTMAYFMSATSHATVAFEEGVRSLQTGKPIGTTSLWGLREHLKSDGEYDDAVLYALARHTLFMDEAKPGYNTGMDIEDAEALIAEVEASGRRERYEAFAEELAEFNDDLIHMLVDAGALPPAEAAKILKAYEGLNYFPLCRVQDVDRSMFAGTGVGFVNLGRAVKRRSKMGSGRQIIDPIDATVMRTIKFYGRAIQVRQQTVLAEALDPLRGGVGGMGGLMDRVDPRQKVTHGRITEILKTLVDENVIEEDDAKAMRIAAKILHPEESGIPGAAALEWFAERHGIEVGEDGVSIDDLEEVANQEPDALAVISLWRPDYTPNSQKRTVLTYDKLGKPIMYEMDHDLYATVTGMDDLQFGPFMSVLRAAARVFKTGAVGISTGFGTANLLRDYWEFQGKARHTKKLNSLGKPPMMLGRYVAEKARKMAGKKSNDPLIRLYEETGGKVYSLIGHDVHGKRMYRRRRIGTSTMSKLGISVKRPLDTIESVVQGAQDVIAVSDAPPRLADAEAAIKEEGFEIREGKWFDTTAGTYVDALPEHVRIKAAVAMAEATINFKRIGAKGQYIEAFMPFFNATVQASYRQYQQFKGLKSLAKKDAEGMRAKRYVVYLSALAAWSAYYWLLRHDDDDWREQDAYLRDGYWTWGTNGKTYVRIPKPRDTAVVANVVENMLDAWYHDDARGMDDVAMRDFEQRMPTGGGLVRGAIETYVAEYDYFRERELTPEYLKDLPKEQQITPYTTRASDTIGSFTGRYLGTSPIQVEHLLNSASGGFYRRLADLYDAAEDGRLGPEHFPFVRGLVIDRHQARSVNMFYEEKEATRIAAYREKAANDDEVSEKTLRKQAVFDGYAELMTKLRDLETKIGKRRGYEYQPYIVGLARHALGYEELESNPNPLSDKNAPEPVKGVMHDYSMRAVYQATARVKDKDEYKNDESYQAAKRSRIRGEAKLKNLGVSHIQAQQLLVQYRRRPGKDGKPRMTADNRKFLTEGNESTTRIGDFDESYYKAALALAKLYGHSDQNKAWLAFRASPKFKAWNAKWFKDAAAKLRK